jgi:hypothetical protein
MNASPELLLIAAVAGVGVLHTMVPDHWVPITLIARQRGWSKGETARAALQAGIGHVLSTLAIALLVWFAGVAAAARFGHFVDTAASLALIAFGGWIAISAWRELHGPGDHHGHGHTHDFSYHSYTGDPRDQEDHDRSYEREHAFEAAGDPLYAPLRGERSQLVRHVHIHRHAGSPAHVHWHDYLVGASHVIPANIESDPPLHLHRHKMTARTSLLLILGSSPMVEGIPAFFAASKYGIGLIAAMSIVFALSTIVTYVLLCTYSTAGLQRVRLGSIERYGEVLSGAFIAIVGFTFWLWPVL